MLIFDQLKKNDPHLRLLALGVLSGLAILAAGLWWVQIVSAREYQENLETQSFRTIRIPAVRGKILDRNGQALAENRPTYNVSLYLEDLKDQFQKEYSRLRKTQLQAITVEVPFWKRPFVSSSVSTQYVSRLKPDQIEALRWESRFRVASNAVRQISEDLRKPLTLNFENFKRHYQTKLALPYPVAQRIEPADIARFEEQASGIPGTDLEIQPTRSYPYQTTAAHLLGHLLLSDKLDEGELAFFNYRLPDYRGVIGIEYAFDAELHGKAGAKSVLVNNLGYRQTENIWSPAEPGKNVVLTIDLALQRAAERALQSANAPQPIRGAAVIMDVNTGDLLALVSAPAFDPNYFVDRKGFPADYYAKIQGITAEKNRATQENYRPGSIFKPVIALACLERGLNPNEVYEVQPHTRLPGQGAIFVGRREIADTAHPGPYSFRRALIHSSNAYFVNYGLRAGIENIVEMGNRLHIGEAINLGTRQETPGTFPTPKRLGRDWSDGDTANLCIGQGYIDVTPLQMTIVAAALANGGKVLSPRLVDRVESPDEENRQPATVLPKGQVRNILDVKPRTLRILEEAMLADTEDPEGTAYIAFKNWPHQKNMRVCGKTGTAQIQNERNQLVGHTTWFLSFAPYEKPKYAVVVMVENGSSGGGTCAPIAKQIYEAIVEREQQASTPAAIARTD